MIKVSTLVKRFAVTALFALFAVVALGQQQIDVVYLKNGSVIRGTLLEYTVGQGVKIKTADGSVFVYSEEEVERVAREFEPEEKPAKTKQSEESSEGGEKERSLREKGFQMFFEAGAKNGS